MSVIPPSPETATGCAGDPPSGVAIRGDALAVRLAVLLAGLAAGRTRLSGLTGDEGVAATANALAAFGGLVREEDGSLVIQGVGNGCLLEPDRPVDVGTDATAACLVAGLAGPYDMETRIEGGALPAGRCLADTLGALRRMGVQCRDAHGDGLPLVLRGPRTANPITWNASGAPPEAVAAVLLAGLNAPGVTTVSGGEPLDDNILEVFRAFGAAVTGETGADGGRRPSIAGHGLLNGCLIGFV